MSGVSLRQLRYVLDVHRRGNQGSAAAEALHTSQLGMIKEVIRNDLALSRKVIKSTGTTAESAP